MIKERKKKFKKFIKDHDIYIDPNMEQPFTYKVQIACGYENAFLNFKKQGICNMVKYSKNINEDGFHK